MSKRNFNNMDAADSVGVYGYIDSSDSYAAPSLSVGGMNVVDRPYKKAAAPSRSDSLSLESLR